MRLLAGAQLPRDPAAVACCSGRAFLVLADLIARTLVAPAEIPIGVITAFIGAPFFLVVLRTSVGARA